MPKRKRKPASFTLAAALEQKERARKIRRKLSFGEKIERMERLRERLRPLKEAREVRRGKKANAPSRRVQ